MKLLKTSKIGGGGAEFSRFSPVVQGRRPGCGCRGDSNGGNSGKCIDNLERKFRELYWIHAW